MSAYFFYIYVFIFPIIIIFFVINFKNKKEHLKLKKLLDNISDCVCLTEAHSNRIIFANPQFQATFQYFEFKREKIFLDAILPKNNLKSNINLLNSLNNTDFELTLKKKDSTVIEMIARKVEIRINERTLIAWYMREKFKTERLERLLEARTKLLEVAEKFNLSDFIPNALDQISIALSSQISFFYKVEADQETITLQGYSLKAMTYFGKDEDNELYYDISKAGTWADCLRLKKAIIHNDYVNLTNIKGLPNAHAPIVREMVVPIFRNNIIVGIIGIGNKLENYNNEDVERLNYLADNFWELYEKKLAKRELEELSQFNENLIRTIPFPMDIVDIDGNIIFASTKLIEMLGFVPIGKKCWEIYKDDLKQCEFCPLTKYPIHNKDTIIQTNFAFNGRSYEISHTPIKFKDKLAYLEIFLDVSEKTKLNAKIVESNRFASMGMLASGVAHEINNPLTLTLLNLENSFDGMALIPDLKIKDETIQSINTAILGVTRVAKIVKNLSAFTRTNSNELSLIDINHTIEIALSMAQNETKYRTQIRTDFESNLKAIANEGKLAQVFLNMIINSVHAMDPNKYEENILELKTQNIGNDVLISIKDTGHGILEENVNKIFDPFFTTKPPIDSTGLGLSISQGIIQEYGGSIKLVNSNEHGTEFLITLPFT